MNSGDEKSHDTPRTELARARAQMIAGKRMIGHAVVSSYSLSGAPIGCSEGLVPELVSRSVYLTSFGPSLARALLNESVDR